MIVASLPYYVVYVIPFTLIMGYALGGVASFLTPLVVFGLIPLLDQLIGTDDANLSAEEMEARGQSLAFRLPLLLYVPIHVALVLWAAHAFAHADLTVLERLGLLVSVGITTGGAGFTIAHELIHARSRRDNLLGRVILIFVGYLHWAVEHVRGHHRNVATPLDPATARMGESVYTFLPRTITGGLRSAWSLESLRLERDGGSRWSWRNEALWSLVSPPLLAAAIGMGLGAPAGFFFLAQCAIAILLLETINYVEHYGLARNMGANGRYETVRPEHSWNSDHKLTSWLLFELPRHSDHHAHAAREYPTLRHHEHTPQLPTGYAGMILLSLFPPLWRRVMDPAVRALQAERPVDAPRATLGA